MRSRPNQTKNEFGTVAITEQKPSASPTYYDLSEAQFNEILQAAIDWQYLIVLSGGMARKSDCESWLTIHYGIDAYTGRQITNTITSGPRYFVCGRDGVEWQWREAHRPAPKTEDYPDIDYSVGAL